MGADPGRRWRSPPSTATAARSSGPSDLVIGITQSGETADTLAAMRLARERGATVLAVTNVMGSQATRDADGVLYTRAGLEVGVAATKTFVSQVAVMYLLGAASSPSCAARCSRETLTQLIAELKRLPHSIDEMLAAIDRSETLEPVGAVAQAAERTGTPSSSSTSAATSACRSRSRAR